VNDPFSEFVNAQLPALLAELGFPHNWVRGEGAYLFDDQGQRYLDMCAGFAVHGLGRNHPAIKAALVEAIGADLPNLVQPDCPALAGRLAEQLVRRSPPSIRRAYFCNSGTETIEAAIKLARRVTGRERMVHCEGAFHGLTTGSLALNADLPALRAGFGTLLPSTAIPLNDLAALRAQLEPGDVAAFFIEPIQGKAMREADDEFLRGAAELCRSHGTLFVADEVQTGLCRTGDMFACDRAGVAPDILTVSKCLSGGFIPVGACLHSQDVHDRMLSPDIGFPHSSTFKENSLAMVAGLAVLEELERGGHLQVVRARSRSLRAGLERLRSKHDVVADVRGRGLMLAVEFRTDPGTVVRKIVLPLVTEGRVVVPPAPLLKLTPPFVLSENDIAGFIDALDGILTRGW